tara:strand:- start:3656 stop:4072 length:417 start_codon:yes stop_codon:yes gene_type:complete
MNNLTSESSYLELATAMRDLKASIDELGKQKSALQKQYDHIAQILVPEKMEGEDIDVITVKGVGRLKVTSQLRCSVKAAHKFDLDQWLRTNGFEDLISTTVNSSTLKAFVKEQMSLGNEVPTDYLNLHAYNMTSLTKA